MSVKDSGSVLNAEFECIANELNGICFYQQSFVTPNHYPLHLANIPHYLHGIVEFYH